MTDPKSIRESSGYQKIREILKEYPENKGLEREIADAYLAEEQRVYDSPISLFDLPHEMLLMRIAIEKAIKSAEAKKA